MGRLVLIRHAQASFLEANYDQLSAIGEEQARRLGQYWVRLKLSFHRVYSGPRVRQKDTARIVAEVYRDAGLRFPEPMIMEAFDEYHADAVLEQGLPQLLEKNEEVRELHRAFQNSSNSDRRQETFEKMFETVISKWVDGEIVLPTVESWTAFCNRVDRGLSQCISANGRGQQLVIFCSGGPIGVAMRRAFHLSSRDTLRAAWMMRNCAYSEFLFSDDRFTLSSFNGFPYLDDASLLTYR